MRKTFQKRHSTKNRFTLKISHHRYTISDNSEKGERETIILIEKTNRKITNIEREW